jgi:hypothetical protein
MWTVALRVMFQAYHILATVTWLALWATLLPHPTRQTEIFDDGRDSTA